MDGNGMQTGGGATWNSLPLGFGIALAQNELAMQRYAGLTEAEKEQIILRCKDAKSKEEMHKIVASLAPDGNVSSLYEGPRTDSGRG
jgi:uncharacterized protein YdeI (YjbR/CyaY-like superfamily)